MERKVRFLTLFFIVSWVGILLMGVLSVHLKIQNLWLKEVLKNSEHSFEATNKLLNEYNNSRSQEKIFEQKTVEHFEWQFVLKEQVKSAGKRLTDSLKLVRTERNKNELSSLLYYNLGLNNMMVLDFNGAANSFEEALRYNPLDAPSCYNLALLYSVYFNNARKAVEYYNRYMKIIPDGWQKDLIKERVQELNNAPKP